MKIVVFGATGNVGRRVVAEALRRGHEVVGVVRDPAAVASPDTRATLVEGDATDAASVGRVSMGADVVVSAISPRPNARGLGAPSLVAVARALIAGLKHAGVRRLMIVGGAGSLEASPGHALVDLPDFPAAYKAESLEQRDALEYYRAHARAIEWTYLSPAAEVGPGARTGRYRTTGDRVLTDAAGKSFITFEDYAVALVDELENAQHVRERFGVAY